MPSKNIFSLYIVFLCTGLFFRGYAQDINYWSHQYGAYSTLLGGTVVGSVSDLSATYYNPGRFILSDTSAFLISANAYQLATIRAEDAAGDGRDVVNSKIAGAPDLVAGNFPWRNFIRPSRMAYSVLQRYKGEFDLIARGGGNVDALPDLEGEEELAAELAFNYKVSDLWVGVTWSTSLNDFMGVGLTQYISFRSMTWNRRVLYQALIGDSGKTASSNLFNDIHYNSYSLVWKLGWSVELGRSNLGVSFTTPYLNVLGRGNVLYDEFISGGDLNGDGVSDDKLVADQQLKRKSTYRSSWSAAAGGSIPLGAKTRLHVSAEYFSRVNPYESLDTEPFDGANDSELLSHAVTLSATSVLNYGVGIEVSGNELADFYGSITSDYSFAPEDTAESITANLSLDLYHLSGGTVLKFGGVNLNLGMVYSFGNRMIPRFSSIYFPPGWEIGEDEEEAGKAIFRRFKLIFGVTVK